MHCQRTQPIMMELHQLENAMANEIFLVLMFVSSFGL